jgi:hypothetical protein
MLKKIGFIFALLFLVLYRIMPHPYNLTPLLSAALFSGLLLKGKGAQLALPLGSMLITDAFLGFYPGMIFTYLAVLAIIGLGTFLSKHKSMLNVMIGAIGASVTFFLVSNLGVWFSGHLYSPTVEGLLNCYVAGLPFLKNTLESSLVFSFAFYLMYLAGLFVRKTSDYLPDACLKERAKQPLGF